MDPELYRATTAGNFLDFIRAMERGPLDGQHGSPAACVQLGPQRNTVLHIATIFGRYEIVKILCKDLPFYVAEKNDKGDTPLHIAARAGDSLLVSVLIGADYRDVLGDTNVEGNSALHEALIHDHEKVARILIDKDRNLQYCINKEGKSVVYLAAEGGYIGLVRVLMENPAGNYCFGHEGKVKSKSPVHAAILGRNIDVLSILWEKDQSSFHIRCEEEGRNALHSAASIGYVEGVSFLLSKLPTSSYQRDKNGYFPIHLASSKGHVTTIQEMLKQCPDSRDLLTLQGENLFHVAAKSGRDQEFSTMLKMDELDKLVNEKDGDGNTPLHVATIFGYPKIVSTLTWDERVKLDLENDERLTALDIAEEYMETMASFQKRLTLMALRVVGALRSPHAKICKNRNSSNPQKHFGTENYKDKVNVVLLVATLIATVTFTAGFTIPGGYNNSKPDQGIATMLAQVKFQEFVICDMIAMYSSIIVAVTLIWAQLGDSSTMQVALKFALPLLGIALAMMSIAFMAGVYLAVSKLEWLANLVLFMGLNFVVALIGLFVPLCCLGSSHYNVLRRISYYPFRVILYAFGSCADHVGDRD